MANPTRSDAEAPLATPMSWFTDVNGAAMETLARSGETFSKAAAEWQQEIGRFTAARFQRDSEFGQKLLACREWSDVMKLQQAWLSAMGQDYVEAGQRLTQLLQKTGGEFMSGAGQGALKRVA